MSTKIIKNKTAKVYKNRKLNNANFGDFTLNEYQVFLQLITKVDGADENGNYYHPEVLQRVQTLTVNEFSLMFNIDKDSCYRIIKRAGTKLMKSFITIEKPELFETWQIAICSTAKYNHKEGSITVEFNDKIMPYLAQVKQRFVLYNLKEVANFGSLYTTRLYELMQEFNDTGWVVKSLAQLRELFAVGNKYPLYRNFKQKTLLHAVEEINYHYDIGLTFKEIKDKRKVVALEFNFKRTIIREIIDNSGNKRNIYIKPKSKIKTTIPKKRTRKPKQLELDLI